MRRRTVWIARAATALVLLVLLLGVLSLVLLPVSDTVVGGGRAMPSSDEVRFILADFQESVRAERVAVGGVEGNGESPEPARDHQSEPEPVVPPSRATLVGALRSDDPTFTGAFEIAVVPANGSAERRQDVDLDRTFRFADLQPGSYRLEIRVPRPEARWWFEGLKFIVHHPYQATLSSRELVLPPGETRVDVALGRDPLESCRVIGWLVGMSGDPGTSYRVGAGKRDFDVATDGSFDVGFQPAWGVALNVSCRVEELADKGDTDSSWFLVATELLRDLPPGGMRTVQIDLPSVSFVTVDVREFGSRRPLPGAFITVRSHGLNGGRSTRGSRSKLLLPEGRYLAFASADRHEWSFRHFEVGEGDAHASLDFELPRAGEHLVRLVDDEGGPIAGAFVSIYEWEGEVLGGYGSAANSTPRTDASGVVDLGFLPGETFRLHVGTEDRVYQPLLEPGVTELVLKSESGSVLLQRTESSGAR